MSECSEMEENDMKTEMLELTEVDVVFQSAYVGQLRFLFGRNLCRFILHIWIQFQFSIFIFRSIKKFNKVAVSGFASTVHLRAQRTRNSSLSTVYIKRFGGKGCLYIHLPFSILLFGVSVTLINLLYIWIKLFNENQFYFIF